MSYPLWWDREHGRSYADRKEEIARYLLMDAPREKEDLLNSSYFATKLNSAMAFDRIALELSLVALLISLAIFLCIRKLRTTNLHCLCLLAAALGAVISGLLEHLFFEAGFPLDHEETPEFCSTPTRFKEYFTYATYFWVFMESLRLLVRLTFPRCIKGSTLLLLSVAAEFVAPIALISTWLMVIRLRYGRLRECLATARSQPEIWILDGPRLLLLAGSSIVVVLVLLRSREAQNVPNSVSAPEVDRMRRGVKAVVIVITVQAFCLGVRRICPEPKVEYESLQHYVVYWYCSAVAFSFQGFLLAFVYCFTNAEVIHALREYFCGSRQQEGSTSHAMESHQLLPREQGAVHRPIIRAAYPRANIPAACPLTTER